MSKSITERNREKQHEKRRQEYDDAVECSNCGWVVRQNHLAKHWGREHPLEWPPWWPAPGTPEANEHSGIWKCQRRRVFDRYGEECQVCDGTHPNSQSEKLDVHHFKPRDEFDDGLFAHRVWNLIPLCSPCHHELENLPEKRQRTIVSHAPFDYGGSQSDRHEIIEGAGQEYTVEMALKALMKNGGRAKTSDVRDTLGWASQTTRDRLRWLKGHEYVSSQKAGRTYLWTVLKTTPTPTRGTMRMGSDD